MTQTDPQRRKSDQRFPFPRVAQFMPHHPSTEGTSAFCRGLSTAMNRIHPGSCPVISFRKDIGAVGEDEEVLHYPFRSKNPLRLPEQLICDLESNRHRLDGIVLHNTYNPKSGTLHRHLKRLGIPYIFLPHDPYVPELTRHHAIRKWAFWHLYEKPMIEGAAAVQLLAASHEAPLREMGCTEVPVEVIPNGCELEALSEIPAHPKVPGSGERVRIQFLGRMDRNQKGLDLLIRGFAEFLKDKISDRVDLVLTGKDWEDRPALEAIARELGVGERVVFTGQRSEHSMEILSEADAVALTSRFDGFGLCIVEAMLAARPVLVSRRAGVSNHVEKAGGGWLVEPDVDSIRDGLCRLMGERPRWPEMGRMNREYVEANLTWEQAARKTFEVYSRRLTRSSA